MAGLLAAIFWGASFIAIKIALKQSQPITLIDIRLGIGLWVLYPIAWMRGDLRGLSLRDHALMILLGVTSTGFAYALYFFALSRSQTTIIAALQYLEVLITLLITVVLLGEIATTMSLLGGGLILLGVAWVERSGRV